MDQAVIRISTERLGASRGPDAKTPAPADRLVVTERSVGTHITAIFEKLELEEAPDQHRRVLAVLMLLRS